MQKPRSLEAKKRASETYRVFHSCEKTGKNNLVPQKVANLYGLELAQVTRAITLATRKHPLGSTFSVGGFIRRLEGIVAQNERQKERAKNAPTRRLNHLKGIYARFVAEDVCDFQLSKAINNFLSQVGHTYPIKDSEIRRIYHLHCEKQGTVEDLAAMLESAIANQ